MTEATPTYTLESARLLATRKHFPELADAIEQIANGGPMPDADWEALSLQGFVEAVDRQLQALAVFATFTPFQDTPTVTGDFRLMAQDVTGTVTVEWIGHPDRILSATLITGFLMDGAIAIRNRLIADQFVEIQVPGLGHWVRQAIELTSIDGPAQSLNGVRIARIPGSPLTEFSYNTFNQ